MRALQFMIARSHVVCIIPATPFGRYEYALFIMNNQEQHSKLHFNQVMFFLLMKTEITYARVWEIKGQRFALFFRAKHCLLD
nr:unnamed protein product [Callosobruchus analis]